jgi:acetyl/propionyl-CoA carboxylase alpha subunit
LQRRHQKVWEEATAPHLKAEVRKGLFDSALKLVKKVKYRGAGTIEFLVDDSGGFYFLEMNTRLQVEHPVTEMVAGVDLVWAQLAQAQAPQETILKSIPEARGAAIEVRLYAEDPSQGFMPTPGRVEQLRWPTGAGIRVESGIEAGQLLGTQFDSMLGKLVVWAENRDHALARMRFALGETVILGMGTNQSYLQAIAAHPAVREGRVHTGFLEQEFGDFAPLPDEQELELISQARGQGLGRAATAGPAAHAALPSPWEAFSRGGA